MKIEKLNKLIPVIIYQKFFDENVLIISVEYLSFILTFLKNHINYKYTLLSCISGVDIIDKKYRFNIVYDLLSIYFNNRLRVKIFINEITTINTITDIFINSNWWEREIWDLFGLYFNKHPDLRRILTDYGFEGYPMRKNFPVFGFMEVRYCESKKKIVTEPLELSQMFRTFKFETPW